MAVIRVVLADDHAQVRAGIRNLLSRAADIEVMGEADNGAQALHLVQELAPDVLVLDMEMPGLKGPDVARQLKAEAAPVRILALSAYEDREFVFSMLNNGAAGYLLKGDAPAMLVDAVRGVSRGETGWISPKVAAKIAGWLPTRTAKSSPGDEATGPASPSQSS
jgi:DNA-binding NarL/FixJ family response regulator